MFWGTFWAALRAPYGVQAERLDYAIETDLTLSGVVSLRFDRVAQRDNGHTNPRPKASSRPGAGRDLIACKFASVEPLEGHDFPQFSTPADCPFFWLKDSLYDQPVRTPRDRRENSRFVVCHPHPVKKCAIVWRFDAFMHRQHGYVRVGTEFGTSVGTRRAGTSWPKRTGGCGEPGVYDKT